MKELILLFRQGGITAKCFVINISHGISASCYFISSTLAHSQETEKPHHYFTVSCVYKGSSSNFRSAIKYIWAN